MPHEKNDITFVRGDTMEDAADYDLIDDVLGGDKTIKSKGGGKTYLPKEKNEKEPTYEKRKTINYFFNATGQAKEELTGKIFRKSPTSNIADLGIKNLNILHKNSDRQGTHIDIFAEECFEQGLDRGMIITLTDFPNTDSITNFDEQLALKIIPYFVHIDKKSVTNYRTEVDEFGTRHLTMLVVKRIKEISAGEYDTKFATVYEEFRVGYKKIHTDIGKGNFKVDTVPMNDIKGNPLTRIPIAIDFFLKTGDFRAKSPLEDMAKENLKHYRAATDRRYATSRVAYSVPIISGINQKREKEGMKGNIPGGPDDGLIFQSPVTWGFLEPSGNGAKLTLEDMQESMRMMSLYRSAVLDPDKNSRAETFGGALLDKNSEDSPLARWGKILDLHMLQNFENWHLWLGLESKVTWQNNADFTSTAATSPMILALMHIVEKGVITDEILRKILRDMGLAIPPEADVLESLGDRLGNLPVVGDDDLNPLLVGGK